jgi:hypothetical protein
VVDPKTIKSHGRVMKNTVDGMLVARKAHVERAADAIMVTS